MAYVQSGFPDFNFGPVLLDRAFLFSKVGSSWTSFFLNRRCDINDSILSDFGVNFLGYPQF